VERTAGVSGGLRHAGRRPRGRSALKTSAALITTDGWRCCSRRSTSASPPQCAEAVGLMDRLVAITVEYMNTRKQFGVHARPASRRCATASPT
jgi:alkylation response protein AidB-like acyl-CoA dehydrogenase